MRTWLRQHRQAFGAAAARFGLLNALVIGVALAVPALGYALLESLRPLAARAALDPQLSVFLAADMKRADADALAAKLRRDARVSTLRFVPREQALKELSSMEGVSELVAALGRNPLPDAFVVTARERSLEPLAAEFARLPGVVHVQADALWARRLAALARIGQLSLWLLAGVLGGGLVAVTFNTIRLQILTQRQEIEVLQLIGADDAFVRRPFYYAGLLQGVCGGALALALVAAALGLFNREIGPLAESYASAFRLSFLPWQDALAIVAFAGFLGLLGAQLAVSRHLRQ